jgi:hypothetical protein
MPPDTQPIVPSTQRDPNLVADSYPNELVLTAVHGFAYRPRFAFQAYSAYHPEIDRRAAANFGDHGVEVALYRHDILDGVHPFFASPAAALEMTRRYDLLAATPDGTLILRRRSTESLANPRMLFSGVASSGQQIDIPQRAGQLVLLEADIDFNLWGRLKNLAYKVHRPKIEAVHDDGSTKYYRLASQNLNAGIIVSDLPRTSRESKDFFSGQSAGRVRSIRIVTDFSYRPTFPIRVLAIDRPAKP